MPRGAEDDPPGAAGRSLTPARWGWAAVLASVALGGALWTRHVAVAGRAAGLFHDEGVYLVTARALAEGAGYRVLSAPGAPPEVRYPPLLPLAVAGVWRLAPRFPDNLPLLKALALLSAIGIALLLPGYLGAAGCTPAVAFATAALTATAPLTLRYATAVASELPFGLMALGALVLLERPPPRQTSAQAALAGVLAGLAFLTRTMGVTVIGAGLLRLRQDRRQMLTFGAAAFACALPWAAWVAVHHGQGGGRSYMASLVSDGVPGPAQLLEHLLALPAAIGVVSVPGLADLLPTHAPLPVLMGVYLCGTVALVSACRLPFAGYVVLTLAVAAAVPWFQPRFLVPLAPFFLASLLAAVLPRGAGWCARAVSGCLLVGLLAAGITGNQRRLTSVAASGLPALEEGTAGGASWSEIEAGLTWLRAATAPGDVVATFHDPVVYLYADRPAVQAYPAIWHPEPAQVSDGLAGSRARWLVDLPCPDEGVWSGARAAWRAWLAAHAEQLTLVYVGGPVRIWRLDEALTAPPPAGTS